jgi:hypothetical protein
MSYTVTRLYYRASVTTRIGGQDNGGPVPLPSPNDMIWLGVSTKHDAKVLIREVWIEHKLDQIQLSSSVGQMVTGFAGEHFDGEEGSIIQTLDRDFPVALRFTGSWIVTRGVFKLLPVSYKWKDGARTVDLRIITYAKIDDADVGFPWDMVNTKTDKVESVFSLMNEDFKGTQDDKLKRYGFKLAPGESLMAGYTVNKGQY